VLGGKSSPAVIPKPSTLQTDGEPAGVAAP